MFRLTMLGKLGLVAVVALVVIDGSLFAQWIDLNAQNSLPDERSVDLTSTVVNEEAKLLASDGEVFDLFGLSVAVCGDVAVAGAPLANSGIGAAYVFVRGGTCGSAWCEQARLLPKDGENHDGFGDSVAVSGDTVVVGATFGNHGTGAAYVFVRGGTCGSAWCEEAKLLASDGTTGDSFGASVAVSGDTAVVGAFIDAELRGSAYVFRVPAGDCDPCFGWKNHGEYVRCVAHAASALVDCGAMPEEEGDAHVRSAAMSDVGKENFVPPPECTP